MVGHSFSSYERELRDLLQGDRSAVQRYAKALEQRPDLDPRAS